MLTIEQTREEKSNTVEKNGVVGRRRLSEKEAMRWEKRRDRGGVGERSEIGE